MSPPENQQAGADLVAGSRVRDALEVRADERVARAVAG
jgi:hypothetical protein